MFDKRVTELNQEDIQRVVAEQVQEGAEVELKETLPCKKGIDPWITNEDRIGDYARNELLAVVIGFANAYGGTLLLGIAQTSGKPARAATITPIRACADLAERFRLQCRDCIEPELPLIEITGVPIQRDGAGVVVIRVPQSRMSPHRHTVTRECYARRADRTEKMTMREIQDLTLHVERGLNAIEHRFLQRCEKFPDKFRQFQRGYPQALAMRATLVPLSPVEIEKVHNNELVRPPMVRFASRIGDGEPFELVIPHYIERWKPILRGTRGIGRDDEFLLEQEIFRDGLIEYNYFRRTKEQFRGLYSGWVMGLFANALCAAEIFRRAASTPSVEYGLEFEIVTYGEEPLPIGRYGVGRSFGRWLGPLAEGQILFPRYNIGPPEEFQDVCRDFETDFWHSVGHDMDKLLTVDFEDAFNQLGILPRKDH